MSCFTKRLHAFSSKIVKKDKMNSISYVYQKSVKDFHRRVLFETSPPEVCADVPPLNYMRDNFTEVLVQEVEFSNIPVLAEASTSTTARPRQVRGMQHNEGGWPKEVDHMEVEHKARYRRKIEKEDEFLGKFTALVSSTERYLRQNNTVNIFEQFTFAGMPPVEFHPMDRDVVLQPMTILRDPLASSASFSSRDRIARGLSWQPVEVTSGNKIAVAYTSPQIDAPNSSQITSHGETMCSHIWDITCPTRPDLALRATSELACLSFSPKESTLICGGGTNGILNLFDTRTGGAPTSKSQFGASVPAILQCRWNSTAGKFSEIVTVNGSQNVNIWDARKLAAPLATAKLIAKPSLLNVVGASQTQSMTALDLSMSSSAQDSTQDSVSSIAVPRTPTFTPLTSQGTHTQAEYYNGVCLDDDVGNNARFLVGTENGRILTLSRRGRTETDHVLTMHVGHVGVVHSVHRNNLAPKYFLTTGDWTFNVWHDEVKTPVFISPFSPTPVTEAVWHPCFGAVISVGYADGHVEVWDLSAKQKSAVFSTQVCDESVFSISFHAEGSILAVATSAGAVHLLRLHQSVLHGAGTDDDAQVFPEYFELDVHRETKAGAGPRRGRRRSHASGIVDKRCDDESELTDCVEDSEAAFAHDIQRKGGDAGITNMQLELGSVS
eukprot:PhM_4_TR18087/c1_g1_i1/m.106341/K11143/DNAI2; dynein intermediate chain 2, axonemal